MEMPKPTEGHFKLEKLAGTWEGKETMHPSQWDPQGGEAVGRHDTKLSLGGFAYVCDYEQERDGVITFTGHGIYTYDPKVDQYALHWFDCMGSPPEVFVGGFDGDVLTLAHGGPGMHSRYTCDLTSAGTMQTTMEMSQDGMEWKLLFEGVYKKT